MSMTTFSGPMRSGTERYNAAENTGLVTLSRTAYVNLSGVALTSGAVAQTLFNLPAGSKILNFVVEVLVAATGNSVSQVAATIGTAATADAYAASFNMGTSVARVAQATVDTAISGKVAALDNIGAVDVPVQATFTATTGNPTAGRVAITVVYQQRLSDGSQVPPGSAF